MIPSIPKCIQDTLIKSVLTLEPQLNITNIQIDSDTKHCPKHHSCINIVLVSFSDRRFSLRILLQPFQTSVWQIEIVIKVWKSFLRKYKTFFLVFFNSCVFVPRFWNPWAMIWDWRQSAVWNVLLFCLPSKAKEETSVFG